MVEVGYRVMEIMELKGSQGFELGSSGGTRKYLEKVNNLEGLRKAIVIWVLYLIIDLF